MAELDPLLPARTALLVMDIQPAIVDANPESGPLMVRLSAAAAAARAAGLAVIYVIVSLRPGAPEVGPHSNKMFAGIKASGRAFEDHVHAAAGAQPGDLVVAKRRVSAFAGSDLEVILRAYDINHLILSGVATSGVVLSTLRQAADMDYRLTVLSDGCLDADPEVHRVLTEKLFPRQATVITTNDFEVALKRDQN